MHDTMQLKTYYRPGWVFVELPDYQVREYVRDTLPVPPDYRRPFRTDPSRELWGWHVGDLALN